MDEPKIKRTVAIDKILPFNNVIYFYADESLISEFEPYGFISAHTWPNYYSIIPDKRYRFADILEYLTNFKPTK